MLTVERLKELLFYDPKNGNFYWKIQTSNRIKIGSIAGHKSKDYIMIRIDGILYNAQCLAFLYMTGKWRENLIDHEDRNKLNNAWINLREADTLQNCGNSPKRSTNKSGFKGVSWSKRRNKWLAQIGINYKTKVLGFFDTPEEASSVYENAAKEHFGEYALVGKAMQK